MVVSNQIHCDFSTKRGDHDDMSRISGNVFAHFILSFSSYNDSAAMDMEPKSQTKKCTTQVAEAEGNSSCTPCLICSYLIETPC